MPFTYTLIASNALTTSATSVTFSTIPNTYTDLVIKMSLRNDGDQGNFAAAAALQINNDTNSNYSWTYIYGNNTTAISSGTGNFTDIQGYFISNGNLATANTFAVAEYYIPSYLSTTTKPLSYFGAPENNSSSLNHNSIGAALYRGTSAITSLRLTPIFGSNFVSGSTFWLYGISNT